MFIYLFKILRCIFKLQSNLALCIAQVYTNQSWLVYFWYCIIPTCSICQHQQVVHTMSCTRRCFELAGITMCFTRDKDIIACQQNTQDLKDLKAIKRQSASKPRVSDPVFLRSSSDLRILFWHHRHWWAVDPLTFTWRIICQVLRSSNWKNWSYIEGNAKHFMILRFNANPTFTSQMCIPLQFRSITQTSPMIITFATFIPAKDLAGFLMGGRNINIAKHKQLAPFQQNSWHSQ